ncbi:testis-expressed protein 22 [Otolemur garnettii]|uniref:testis-expressed protein 22 n=1 Tax=Otolemur garnettii TaxID=30611 RepID=UPI000274280A|nr:testis-expressed protein 22 [Otolemur garnettii]
MTGQELPPQGRKPASLLFPELRQPSSPVGPVAAWVQSSAQSSIQEDWVCEPPDCGRWGRHWSISIDERRRLAVLGSWKSPGCGDIMHIVAQLVSEDVDKDVLFSHPLRPAESASTFLARSSPFWHETLRSPPS